MGIQSFDRAERDRLIEESPALNTDRIETPLLMLYQKKSAAEMRRVLNRLRRDEIASALFLYDDDHSLGKPASNADVMTRIGEWLDYWVRDIPFPEPGRATEYMSWEAQ